MSGYINAKGKCTRLNRKIKYVKSHDVENKDKDFYNSTNDEFWKELAKESRDRFKESKPGGTCIEARSIIMGIPQNSNITAKEICGKFKEKYGVECICAIHTKRDEQGNITNKHAHIIYSERTLLDEPKIVEEKRSPRNRYYKKEKGKRVETTKKEYEQHKSDDNYEFVPKGTITTKGSVHKFSDKNKYFQSMDFVNDLKETFLKNVLKLDWNLENDIENRKLGLSQKHIGYKNVNSDYIKDNNELKQMIKASCEVNYFYLEQDLKFKNFKDYTENILKSNNVINLRTKSFKENYEKMVPYINKTIDNYYDEIFKTDVVNNTLTDLNNINEEIIEKASQPLDVTTNDDITFIERLHNTWKDLLANLKHFLHFQKFFINPEYHITLAKDEDNYIYKVNGEDNSNTEEDSEGIER